MLVERYIAKLNSELATAQAALATAQTTVQNDSAAHATTLATIKTESANKDAEIVTLKKQLDDSKVTPKKLQDMARARAHVEQRAKALMRFLHLRRQVRRRYPQAGCQRQARRRRQGLDRRHDRGLVQHAGGLGHRHQPQRSASR